MRSRLFEIIEAAHEGDRLSRVYDIIMIVLIVASIVPLCFKEPPAAFSVIDWVCTGAFCLDYSLRFATADYKLHKGGRSFALYPFTPFAIIDLLSILPSFLAVSSTLKLLRSLRLLRSFRVFRSFKFFRYSRQFETVIKVIKTQKVPLLSVLALAVGYIFLTGLIMFNVEPDSFDSFFESLYWATTALTTVGYGDIYPVSTVGQIVSMVSSLMGIAVVALPAGIITSGYMEEISKSKK